MSHEKVNSLVFIMQASTDLFGFLTVTLVGYVININSTDKYLQMYTVRYYLGCIGQDI